ncbi:MAG: TolC family protein [Salinivirgaceae bacterium]|nr:TolC family protein [Salinivirgaceae bacterium]
MQNRIIQFYTTPIIVLIVLIITLLVGWSKTSNGQNVWDLKRCVSYAVDNNINLSLSNNDVNTQKINLLESKAQILPVLNMGTGLNFNFGRSIDPATDQISFNQNMNNSYWIESSVNIFQGLIRYNTISYNNYLLAASEKESDIVYNKLIFDIISSYNEVLYSQGLESVARKQVDLSFAQYTKMLKMVEVGKESPITAQELKSQWASDKLNLTQTQTQTQKALLKLKQLLRLKASSEFSIDSLNMNSLVMNHTPAIDSLFSMAINQMPDIKKEEFLLYAAKKDLAVAKGNISPRLYLSGGFGSNYFDGDVTRFQGQLKNNQNEYVNMGIVIPIFNKASTYSKIKRKKLAVKSQELQLELKRELLYTEIWNSINDLLAAEREFDASTELFEFSNLSFANISKKLEKGLASPSDYELAKQRMVSAEAGLLKARLIYVMRNQMLEFYKTGNWDHIF